MNAYEWKAEPVPEQITAEYAAMSLLLSFVNVDIRCWRAQRPAGRKAAAEALFPKLVKQRGKTKAIEVVRR